MARRASAVSGPRCTECYMLTTNVNHRPHARLAFGDAVAFSFGNNQPFRPGAYNVQKALMQRTV